MDTRRVHQILSESIAAGQVHSRLDGYVGLHSEEHGGRQEDRKSNYTSMINDYYDLVTDFYEYGWGQSFHFAPRYRGETFRESIARHQHFMAARLGLRPGMTALDVGCGVGGPMRGIARFSGANVVGINNNDYQIKRGQEHNQRERLAHLCSFIKGDFMNIPAEPETFDAAFAFEATCHAPDKTACFEQIYRVLKPGGQFAAYEWCITDAFIDSNAEHQRIKKGIEEGDALPDIARPQEVLRSLTDAGFEIVEHEDRALAADPETPWYQPLAGEGYTPRELRMKPLGRLLTRGTVKALEAVHLAPEGSAAVAGLLEVAALALVAGGKTGIFTPMYYFRARKPA